MVMKNWVCVGWPLFLLIAFVFFFSCWGCASTNQDKQVQTAPVAQRVVKSGDKIFLEFTCYRENGKMAATTNPATAELAPNKSALFVPPRDPGPVEAVAGTSQIDWHHKLIAPVDFDKAIAAYLAEAVVGKPYDQQVSVVIKAETQKGITETERFLKLYRRQKAKMRDWADVAAIKKKLGRPARVGDTISTDTPVFSFKVVDIQDGKALLEASFEDGASREDFLGKKRFVHIDDEEYEIIIDTTVGHVFRTGELVGRVVEVDEKLFLIDFGNPFGGIQLQCDAKASY